VVEAGAIGPLVRALSSDARAGANLGGQLAAMTALASLVRTLPRCQKEMVRAGAVGRLMALVNPPGQMRQLKETAALVLTELATDDRDLQETVGGSGAIAVLVGMLNGPGKGKLAAARELGDTGLSTPMKH
jgi:redox-regulated HSP33 family molecular chaperone